MEIIRKTDLVLLHGALGSEMQFEALRNLLGATYTIHTFNFSGHGGLKIPDLEFSVPMFEKDVLNYMTDQSIESAHFFGYSMGGYVALSVAAHFPEKVRSILTLATKFDWSPQVAQKEISMLNPDVISVKLPEFAEQLAKRHQPSDWKMLLQKTAGLMTGLGANHFDDEFFKTVKCPVRVGVGDRDKMVSVQETMTVFKSLPLGSFTVLPQTPHPFELVNTDRLVFEITSFCK